MQFYKPRPRRTIEKKIKVERGIPLPPLNPTQILWAPAIKKLQLMESFLLSTRAECVGAMRAARKEGLIVTSRKVNGGYRIWRVE